ncbi:hypothetical protein L7D45_09025 [Brucella pseudogrignonensis]|uniref:hypothetical protein n=1 Tax=Brucella pseudogrignonensis TaxID=419475 RepID=UPI001EDA2DAC|nr:hypothetical protein [Brucella pseudogrignonensis]UKK92052.1 hypothetical protein L7D45_09025 [Brucella pseudogrignonensis]
MAKPSGDQIRRVYVLPNELVDRITAFQAERGFSSEVEAVRKLLNDALQSKDTPEILLKRAMERMRIVRVTSEVAREILVGHPLVSEIKFENDDIDFWVKSAGHYKINYKGELFHDADSSGNGWEFIQRPD